ncbi:hypothetical protein ABK040_000220 [Willaertia magna]
MSHLTFNKTTEINNDNHEDDENDSFNNNKEFENNLEDNFENHFENHNKLLLEHQQESFSINLTTIKEEEETTKWYNKYIKLFSGQFLAHICLIGTLLTFGGYCVITPHVVKMIHPTIFATIRVFLISITLLPISLIIDRNYSFRSEKSLQRFKKYKILQFFLRKIPKWKLMKQIGICGVILMLNQVTFIFGLSMTNATMSGIMQPLIAVMVCIISILLKKESKSIIKIIGVIIAVSGALLMLYISTQFKQQFNNNYILIDLQNSISSKNLILSKISFFIGTLFLILNCLSVSIYLLLLKNLLEKKIPAITLTFWAFLSASFIPLIISLYYLPTFNIHKIDKETIIGLFYAGIIHGAFSFVLGTTSSKLTSPTIVAIYNTISPIVSTAMAFIVLNERVSPFILVGAVFIIIGVAIVVYSKWREAKQLEKISAESKDNKKEEEEEEIKEIPLEEI